MASGSVSVSVEWLAYLALALAALTLRLAALDAVPLGESESEQALHAWHTLQETAPGDYRIAHSPLTYLTQLLSFSVLGASAFSARIGVALAGAALSLTPLLFRESLGVTRSFVWALLLSVLTVPVASSRTADGTAFIMLFTLLGIWMIRRYWYSQALSDAIWASVFVTMMVFLSGPSGIPLFIILLLAGWMAVWRTALSAPQRLDLPGDDILRLSLRRLHHFPFARVALIPLAIVFFAATAFMLNPGGLRTVGALIEASLSPVARIGSGLGLPHGIVALLSYEALLIVFALGGAWLLWRHGAVSYLDRFAAAWAGVGALGLLLYPGTRPADAMWVVLPLSLLASYGINQLMVNRRVAAIWGVEAGNGESDSHDIYTTRFWWVKWLISALALLLLILASVQFLQVGRALLEAPGGIGLGDLIERVAAASYPRLAQGLGMLLTTAIIALVLYSICASFWGHGTCLQGLGLGFLWFMLMSGVGGAWRTSVTGAHEPAALWHGQAVARDADLLRATLFDLADRQARGFPLYAITIISDEQGVTRADGLLAWLLRDFPKARFVRHENMAAGEPIVISAHDPARAPDLGGDYVGQRFLLRRNVYLAQINPWQLPAWWSQRRLRDPIEQEDAVILWLRQDIYDGGTPADIRG